MGGGSSRQVHGCVCRSCWSDTHNGFRLAACPLSGGFGMAVRRFLSIDTHGSSKLSNLGRLSQQGCQQTRRRQWRNRRVRAVERGLLSEPAWLRAYPGRQYFEPEKPAPTQIPRNVWDTGTVKTGGGGNYNSERKLAKRKVAPRVGFELPLTATDSSAEERLRFCRFCRCRLGRISQDAGADSGIARTETTVPIFVPMHRQDVAPLHWSFQDGYPGIGNGRGAGREAFGRP